MDIEEQRDHLISGAFLASDRQNYANMNDGGIRSCYETARLNDRQAELGNMLDTNFISPHEYKVKMHRVDLDRASLARETAMFFYPNTIAKYFPDKSEPKLRWQEVGF